MQGTSSGTDGRLSKGPIQPATHRATEGENAGSGAFAMHKKAAMLPVVCFPLSKAASVWENNLKKRDQRITTDRKKVA